MDSGGFSGEDGFGCFDRWMALENIASASVIAVKESPAERLTLTFRMTGYRTDTVKGGSRKARKH